MWDGDLFKLTNIADTSLSSEPTVWDGDIGLEHGQQPLKIQVLSPPCGMATIVAHTNFLEADYCSKPTVWDGDFLKAFSYPMLTTCSKPTGWDGDTCPSASLTAN